VIDTEKAKLASFIDAGGHIEGIQPIAVLSDEYMNCIGAKTSIIMLSSDTLKKNLAHHPEVTAQDYMNLQSIIECARVVVQDSKSTLVFVNAGNRTYHAAIKATRTGKGVFMTSLRLTRESYVERIKKAGKVIKD
jgi:hypothetical protein